MTRHIDTFSANPVIGVHAIRCYSVLYYTVLSADSDFGVHGYRIMFAAPIFISSDFGLYSNPRQIDRLLPYFSRNPVIGDSNDPGTNQLIQHHVGTSFPEPRYRGSNDSLPKHRLFVSFSRNPDIGVPTILHNNNPQFHQNASIFICTQMFDSVINKIIVIIFLIGCAATLFLAYKGCRFIVRYCTGSSDDSSISPSTSIPKED